MTTAADVLRVAASQIGYVETPRNRTKYGRWYGINPAPWCAMFVSWCEYTAGNRLSIQSSRGFAACVVGEHYYRSRGAFYSARKAIPGDLVFFDFDRNGSANHVGLVEKNLGNTLITIEGNTSGVNQNNGGQVRRRSRPINNKIRGVGRPRYGGGSPVVAAKPHILTKPPVGATWQRDGKSHPVISKGSHGAGVLHMQQLLHSHGGNIIPDGVFGPSTRAVLIQYQRGHGLVVDGNCGPLTWASLHR